MQIRTALNLVHDQGVPLCAFLTLKSLVLSARSLHSLACPSLSAAIFFPLLSQLHNSSATTSLLTIYFASVYLD
jgi:hypothetical protein